MSRRWSMLTFDHGLDIIHLMLSTSKNEEFVYQAVQEGFLEIAPDGTIWRVKGRRKKQLAAKCPPSTKYLTVKIMRQGKQVSAGVHRLVYFHFKGPIPPGLTINHKDGNTINNHPDNLEIATYAEQVRHSIEVLGRKPKDQDGDRNAMAKLTANAVREIRRRRAAGESLKSIATSFGVTIQAISKIALGQRWAFLG